MARVTEGDVKQLVDTDRSVGIFIDTANLYVTRHLATAITDSALLEKIELYLAAHFTAVTEERGGLIFSGMGDARESMANVYKSGLGSTRFGQQAIVLDETGKLAALSRDSLKAQFRVV